MALPTVVHGLLSVIGLKHTPVRREGGCAEIIAAADARHAGWPLQSAHLMDQVLDGKLIHLVSAIERVYTKVGMHKAASMIRIQSAVEVVYILFGTHPSKVKPKRTNSDCDETA